ncbi:cytochrome b subunit of formate dehydrogenase [Rhodoblastus acidophilus]|uniref:ethylbenzene dehydrogenase-related protein n=1 Tax=Rhodoblastus acidophilus TaxID=1074 RepID=UPI002224D014|nr:ethylbenzene dehydrogenase-related protein [Rhodoblastus acidophilus]MCW2285396.1 cytochrome b subunit of formate dehydrogenase [Rhodoblastus acidophilus]MCW2334356.1 cytochrome b subunit of formate dehydrogenase [Rhodoblastus acidophilus]
MQFRYKKTKRTDAGTVVLHWSLVICLALSVLTGLRFAVDMPDTGYLDAIAPYLPVSRLWIIHIAAGVGLMGLAVAYLFYLRNAGLLRRVALDRARLAALKSPGAARWSAVNVLLYWLFFLCLVSQIVTGVLLHRGHGGALCQLHLWATWAILGYAVAHVLTHLAMGGFTQALRILRPTQIPVAASGPAPLGGALVFLLSALIGGLAGGGYLYADRASRDVLHVQRIDKAAAAPLGPDLWASAWRDAPSLAIHTNQGVNLDGSGASLVEIRALHDEDTIYFAFTWEDPTRSLKHAPLIKTENGWRALFSESRGERRARLQNVALRSDDLRAEQANFEGALNEDKFAFMLANVEKPFGPGAFHPGKKPLPDKPESSSGRGLHYTEDGGSVNVWLWRASGIESGRCENNRVGPATRPSQAERHGEAPYKGGYASKPEQAVAYENVAQQLPRDPSAEAQPLRLPRDLAATREAMGAVDLDPDHGDQENARWAMREDESTPYTADMDARIPVGAIIPGMIATPPRAKPSDVFCTARWAAGRWTLLAQRKLDTKQDDDIVLGDQTFMWVGVFDHTPANHTRHIRPFKLEMQR